MKEEIKYLNYFFEFTKSFLNFDINDYPKGLIPNKNMNLVRSNEKLYGDFYSNAYENIEKAQKIINSKSSGITKKKLKDFGLEENSIKFKLKTLKHFVKEYIKGFSFSDFKRILEYLKSILGSIDSLLGGKLDAVNEILDWISCMSSQSSIINPFSVANRLKKARASLENLEKVRANRDIIRELELKEQSIHEDLENTKKSYDRFKLLFLNSSEILKV